MDLVSNTTMKFLTTGNSVFHIPSDVFANIHFFTVYLHYINI